MGVTIKYYVILKSVKYINTDTTYSFFYADAEIVIRL